MAKPDEPLQGATSRSPGRRVLHALSNFERLRATGRIYRRRVAAGCLERLSVAWTTHAELRDDRDPRSRAE